MQGKIAIVTGASRGIGKAIALGYAHEGATVVVAARSESAPNERLPGSIHETVAEIEARGGRALAVRLDVTDEASVATMVETTLAHFGRIDVLVNNAAVDFPVTGRRYAAQALGSGPAGQRDRTVPVLAGGAPGHDRPGRREHHQHHLGGGHRAGQRHGGLQRRSTPLPRRRSTASPGLWPRRSVGTTSP